MGHNDGTSGQLLLSGLFNDSHGTFGTERPFTPLSGLEVDVAAVMTKRVRNMQ